MNKENTKALFEKYPDLYQQKDLDMRQTAMCWGFSCGDGWYSLIDNLSHVITQHVENINDQYRRFKDKPGLVPPSWVPNEEISVQAVQVKEKFGGLRFYVNGSDEYISGAISMAENLSYTICEHCGSPGKPNSKGWIHTLCEPCREEHKNRFSDLRQLKIPFEETNEDD